MFTDLFNSISEAVERGEMTEAQAAEWRAEAAEYELENGRPERRPVRRDWQPGSVTRREPLRLFYYWLHTFRAMEASKAKAIAKLDTPEAQELWRVYRLVRSWPVRFLPDGPCLLTPCRSRH